MDTDIHRRQDKDNSIPTDRRDFWDGRAQEFSVYAASTGYAGTFIRIMKPCKKWTVLDMACGGGTIAVPLAPKVKSITAVDFSKPMLDIVDRRCGDSGIVNVKTLQGRWEDDWEQLGIGVHDVAIASRSLIGDDPKGAITKLIRVARKVVFISLAVGQGPFDKKLFESTGRRFTMKRRDYIYYYTLLYKMGITANVIFIPEEHRNRWGSHEEAFEDHRWMFHNKLTECEEVSVRKYLKDHLVKINDTWRLSYSRKCLWALMWWKKENGGAL